ncbi:MAG: hypothetical protein QOK04_2435 [Solirubrobacteraceae bacterium]|nr:hypothetical protein [Solirubrobacteraceae bacterium]
MAVGWQVPIACALACAALPGGCGNDSVPTSSAPKAPAETRDTPPKLPRGWRRVVNPRAGFSVGIPPAWSARGAAGTTLVRSSDRALALTVTADRSEDGRESDPKQYAARLVSQLPRYRKLQTGLAKPVQRTRYPTASVTASGVYSPTGVRQAIVVFAISRQHRVMYAISVFRAASTRASRYDKLLETLVRSFSAAPPQY